MRLDACHWLLLRLAGIAPDELITQCRTWLGEGRMLDLGQAVAHAVCGHRLRVTESDVSLLVELLAADGTDASALTIVGVTDLDPLPNHAFAPNRERTADRLPAAADVRSPDRPAVTDARERLDRVDRAAIDAAAVNPFVRAVWRTWRCASGTATWPPPRRVVICEVDSGGNLAQTAATIGDEMAAAGEPTPQVEVYPSGLYGSGLPSYQRLARAHAALLWRREPPRRLRLARSPDPADPPAGMDSVRFEDLMVGEITQLIGYLKRAAPVLQTPARGPDLYDPAAPEQVPLNYRTDGFWVWTDAIAYYLEYHRRLPERDLIQHVRRQGFVTPVVDAVTMADAVATVPVSALTGPVWLAD
ncbi:hypothetical protein Val02_09920 [Virgisporangium aliadipatigenens]|uniref:Uncharacterized protein n=1 Tax=Virgisporangium aliadipatigenens TaxID=741659 RepID=A0A8J3YHN1_9ACTN|nr:hypothetical protein [Virgisporangium aliadipatigenens]GIJ44106.1 hypothetical protein Val02_09920 [Virgisporangium aliadipatigenens]